MVESVSATASAAPGPTNLEFSYECNRSALGAELSPLFTPLHQDDAATEFIQNSYRAPHGSLRRGLQRVMRHFVSDFDANGLLGTYPMHLLSTAQWRRLLGPNPGLSLLDIGAGDGRVTEPLAALFDAVSVTETSQPMAWRLRRRGYTCFVGDVSHTGISEAPYDAVSLLNVLDRCAAPLSLLSAAANAVAPGGLLILALALPYRPFFYSGGTSPRPMRPLPLNEEMSFEDAVGVLVRHVLRPMNLAPIALSRAPYLSWGDQRKPLYSLDNALIVCQKS